MTWALLGWTRDGIHAEICMNSYSKGFLACSSHALARTPRSDAEYSLRIENVL